MEGKSELVGNVVTWAGVFLDLCLIFFDLQWGVLHEFVFVSVILSPASGLAVIMVQKDTSSWGQSISPDLLVPKPPDTTEMSKREHFQIWKCRMEENWLQVFIKIHILMIFSFTWRNTGSLDIEHGLKIQNCGQTLLSYISLLNYVSLGYLNKVDIQLTAWCGCSCKMIHL